MKTERNNPLYIIEDEADIDEGRRNYASYIYDDESQEEIEESDEEEDAEEETESKQRRAISLMFQIMFNPVEGWKTLRRSKISIEKIQSGCFYPLLAILAISKFADFFYYVNVSLTQVVTDAVISFVSYFFAYFSIPVILSWFVSKDATEKVNGEFGKQFILLSLSTLALFSILINALPMLWPILIFLPIWTIYLMFKGIRFFHFSEQEETKVYILSVVCVVGFPLLIDWVFTQIMPY